MILKGWIELDGEVLSPDEILEIISLRPGDVTRFGGEFFLTTETCLARDHFGIMPGLIPPGSFWCHGRKVGDISPVIRTGDLDGAITEAVRLRSAEGVTALSGGVDSAMVAALARRPCLVIGVKGSHDIIRAQKVARELNLPLTVREVRPADIEAALPRVLRLIIDPSPVDLAIATTLFFVAETARSLGYRRILTGQGADEIFGGYARYADLSLPDLEETFARDFSSLSRQGARDQAVAGYHGAWLSMPYLDIRVVCAAAEIPPVERVSEGIRKRPLREVAARYLTRETAYYEKKAMQYGSGIWKEIKRLARQNGYQNSVSEYIHNIRRLEE